MQITVRAQATIYDIDKDLEKFIKRTHAGEDEYPLLRVTNPKYLDQIKFGSKFGNSAPKWVNGYRYDPEDKSYSVPRAWLEGALVELDISCNVKYYHTDIEVVTPEPILTPLAHQEAALNELFTLVNSNDQTGKPTDTCIVMNTSAGKTILGMFAAHHSSQKTLVVVPTKEIEAGWVSDACKMFGLDPKDIGQIRAGNIRIGGFLTIGSVQTLMNLDPELWADKFGMVILDELHKLSGTSFSKVLQNSNAGIRLGLTATDNRKDGLIGVVKWYLGHNCYENMTPMNCTDLTYMGIMYSGDVSSVGIKEVIDTKKMKSRLNKYKKQYLAKCIREQGADINSKEEMKELGKRFKVWYKDLELHEIIRSSKESKYQNLVRGITESEEYNNFLTYLCQHIIDNYQGDILISSSSIEHIGTLISKITTNLGVTVAKLTGTGTKNREKLYAEIKQGKYKITVGTQSIVSTGASNPKWAHVIIATPFSNEELAVQIKGRPIRIDPENPSKTMGYVWDMVVTSENMCKNMARTRFKALEPYVQDIKWIKHIDL